MRKSLWVLVALSVAFILCAVIMIGIEQTKASSYEIMKVQEASKAAIASYLNKSITVPVHFIGFPVCYDENKWVNECYIDVSDENSTRQRTDFDVFVRKEGRIWKAKVVHVVNP